MKDLLYFDRVGSTSLDSNHSSGEKSDYLAIRIPLCFALFRVLLHHSQQSSRARVVRNTSMLIHQTQHLSKLDLLLSGVMAFVPLLLVEVANKDALHRFCIQFLLFLVQHMHICDATEHPKVCQVWVPLDVQFVQQHLCPSGRYLIL